MTEYIPVILYGAFILFWIIIWMIDCGIKNAIIMLAEHAFIPFVLFAILSLIYGFKELSLVFALLAGGIYIFLNKE